MSGAMTAHSLLDTIKTYEDFKKIPENELPRLALEIRNYIVDVVSKNGGHLASNLGSVELTLALHHVFDSPVDKIIFDVGHQCYTHKIITGRKDEFRNLRKMNGISGFPRRIESSHDIVDTGHASTSISVALGILTGQQHQENNNKVIAVIGDGSLTGGMALEALNYTGHTGKNLIIVVNDNTMSISKNVGALSSYLSRITATGFYQGFQRHFDNMVKRIPFLGKHLFNLVFRLKKGLKAFLFRDSLFSDFGFDYIGPINGHNIRLMTKIFRNVRQMNKPVVVHVKTRKGKGYSHAECDPTLFHGVSAFSIVDGKIEKKKSLSFTEAFSETIMTLGREDERIIAITAAMSAGTGLTYFQSCFADRFFDVGIAEEHAVTFSSGLAIAGLRPVVAIYSTFMQRAVDQVIHDIALPGLPVIIAMDRSGIVEGDGETHQGLFDIALFKGIPNMTLVSPANKTEMELLLRYALTLKSPFAIRYPKALCGPEMPELSLPVKGGRGVFVRSCDSDTLIITTGGLLSEALEAANQLAQKQILIDVYNLRFLKPIDTDHFRKIIFPYTRIFIVEDGAAAGGIGESLIKLIFECKQNIMVRQLAVPDRFIPHGSRKELLAMLRLDCNGIAETVSEMIESNTEDNSGRSLKYTNQ
ncbi:MAG: 1-deoxy-D-xylulose-5-phosphate synthase [Spirochaetales bacterium]|nr:1-deoxy-D-xylulose-5-phosphate synthase [Spirochaetales bacterium]